MSQNLQFPRDSPDRSRDRQLRTSIQASTHLVSVSFLEQFHQSILCQVLLFMVQSFLSMRSRTSNFVVLGSSDEKSEQLPRKKDLAHIRIRTSSVAMNRNKIESSMQIELNFVGVESKGSCSSNILRPFSFRTQRLTRKQDRPHYKFSRVFASAKFGHFPRIPEIFHLRFRVCLCDMSCDLNDKSLWSSQTQDLEWKTFPLQNNSVLILST